MAGLFMRFLAFPVLALLANIVIIGISLVLTPIVNMIGEKNISRIRKARKIRETAALALCVILSCVAAILLILQ